MEALSSLSPPKVEVPVDPARLRGDPKAPVTIVEFSDFSCPFCRKAEATVKELLLKYPGGIKVSYRDFPSAKFTPRGRSWQPRPLVVPASRANSSGVP